VERHASRPGPVASVELATGCAWSWSSLPSPSAGSPPSSSATTSTVDRVLPFILVNDLRRRMVLRARGGPRPSSCDAHGFDYGSSAGSLPLRERGRARWVGVTRCRASVEPKGAPACSVGASGRSPEAPTELETVPSKHSR
jgi:guanyl-specific ribonuclease Sa